MEIGCRGLVVRVRVRFCVDRVNESSGAIQCLHDLLAVFANENVMNYRHMFSPGSDEIIMMP